MYFTYIKMRLLLISRKFVFRMCFVFKRTASVKETMGVRVEGQEIPLLELLPKTALTAAGRHLIH